VRYVSRLVKHDKTDVIADDLRFKDDASYLITGGMGGLGLKVCHWLISKGAKNLILVGRNKPQNIDTIVSELTEPTSAIIKIAQVDVSNESELKRLLQDVSMPPLKGIFHCAGVVGHFATTPTQMWDYFQSASLPKISGTLGLHNITQTIGISLDHFVLFSSIASALGGGGQTCYAYGNAFLDGFAYFRKQQGLSCLVANWGPWGEVGMALNLKNMERLGLSPMSPQNCLMALEYSMLVNATQMVIVSLISKKDDNTSERFKEKIMMTEGKKRSNAIRKMVANKVKKVLGYQPNDDIDDQKGFFELGMDSLGSMELRTFLKEELGEGVVMSATIGFDYPLLAPWQPS